MSEDVKNRDTLRQIIEHNEGRRSEVYTDTAGHPTVGVGFNLDRTGAKARIEAVGANYQAVRNGQETLTDEQINSLLDHDIDQAIAGARNKVSNFDELIADRQSVVVDMVFNMGEAKFGAFKKTITAIENNEFDKAADEMEDSSWFSQVGSRAQRNVNVMRGAEGFGGS